MNIDNTKLISELTVEEYTKLFIKLMNIKTEKKYVYGLKGLARLLGCSRTKAYKVKKSGILDAAITKNGRLLIIDKEQVLELVKSNPTE